MRPSSQVECRHCLERTFSPNAAQRREIGRRAETCLRRLHEPGTVNAAGISSCVHFVQACQSEVIDAASDRMIDYERRPVWLPVS